MIVVMNILVIGAHPDDESIGAGGAIAKHIENGDTVFIVLFSVGHTPIQPKLKDQTYDMLNVFGIKKKNLFWLNCKSGNFDLEDKIKINSKLTEIINDINQRSFTLIFMLTLILIMSLFLIQPWLRVDLRIL